MTATAVDEARWLRWRHWLNETRGSRRPGL